MLAIAPAPRSASGPSALALVEAPTPAGSTHGASNRIFAFDPSRLVRLGVPVTVTGDTGLPLSGESDGPIAADGETAGVDHLSEWGESGLTLFIEAIRAEQVVGLRWNGTDIGAFVPGGIHDSGIEIRQDSTAVAIGLRNDRGFPMLGDGQLTVDLANAPSITVTISVFPPEAGFGEVTRKESDPT